MGREIYVDHFTGLILIYNHISLRVGETLVVDTIFVIFPRYYVIQINHIHGGNGFFSQNSLKMTSKKRGRRLTLDVLVRTAAMQ